MKIKRTYYQIISCCFFSLLGLQIKLALLNGNIENIVFFRSFFGTLILFCFIILSKKKIISLVTTKKLKIHFLRSIFGILAMYFGYKSLIYLSLAQASTIGFTKVFFACIFSSFIFSEKINFSTLLLILIGFSGILFITNPGEINNKTGLYMSLFSAISVSGGIISISYLSKKEETTNILFFHSLLSSIIFFIIFWQKIDFRISEELTSYIFLTITALLGQYFNTESYKYSETKDIVILSYSRIIFSTLLGFMFLNEKLTLLNIAGILLIIFTTFIVQRKTN
ncbi:MAG: DMT family transporter [Pseudomonadota bacterium]|nr:DMT family transporter [Pseudomonadota bacterium]